MGKVHVVDVTLRDGGCVIDFNFGDKNMQTILDGLNASKVDCIEVGYINETKGTVSGRTQFKNERVIVDSLLQGKKKKATYLAMIDYGTFDVAKLEHQDESGIDGIRFAFHKKDFRKIGEIGRTIIDKGYQFFVQPMLTLRYSDRELLELIELVNQELPDVSGFYIVDSFGEMRYNDVIRALNLVDNNLNKNIPVGFHSHNNLQLSYANAISVLQFPTTRDIYLDSSIMGMGKGAGNLISELLLGHLNLYYQKNYEISPLLNVIDTVLDGIHATSYWGYSAEYYLSAINHCTPSYARHFHCKHMLPINEIAELLAKIEETKKISFDKNYADEIYHNYLFRPVDDSETIQNLTEIFGQKKVLVLAPGRSIEDEREKILNYISTNDVIVLSINAIHKQIPCDYVFISNRRRYKSFCEVAKDTDTVPLICTSNVPLKMGQAYLINYADYTCNDPVIESNAGMMALNLMLKLGVKSIVLAGFDGFGFERHAEDAPPDPMTGEEWKRLNKSISTHIRTIEHKATVEFLTKSGYCI
ncbi:MAG: pyruvate carboxyltransferase [Clostridiales bacterium]|uniref:aldolase catalytic domain-containing protein n=1 Tax=Provencibacterium massiliense TaxID=1841868 RepID=UPI0009A7DAB2|nr:aldolase catalytic domain-containing protein [Provencibacterium massiliense]PWM34406.1 MAG: pyruvate carboxyltransferase [Clostridiales bacterium]RGB64313.1 pyruvate carboxyltransferase [Harryflintia acetispora]